MIPAIVFGLDSGYAVLDRLDLGKRNGTTNLGMALNSSGNMTRRDATTATRDHHFPRILGPKKSGTSTAKRALKDE